MSNVGVPELELYELAQALVDAPSPNPPGDVRLPLEVAAEYLARNGISFTRVSSDRDYRKVNLVARVYGAHPGPHLVMNAHLDVFPPSNARKSPTADDGSAGRDGEPHVIRGRGAVDMKGGAAAFMVSLKLLHERRQRLHGQVSLCLVCDEEVFGPWGSRALLEMFPDLYGDALLSSEPSSTSVIRIGERGFIWGAAEFPGEGGHGAYPSGKASPIERASAFVRDLRGAIPEAWKPEDSGTGAKMPQSLLAPVGKSFVDAVSLNFGTIAGGITVNMKADHCRVGLDFRVPLGRGTDEILNVVREVVSRHDGTFHLDNSSEPNKSDANAPLFTFMKAAVERVTGTTPAFAIGLGCTDARLWRRRGIPAAVYGPDPSTMAHDDEKVGLSELTKVANVHLQTALQFLGEDM